jgi:hypothetical protein
MGNGVESSTRTEETRQAVVPDPRHNSNPQELGVVTSQNTDWKRAFKNEGMRQSPQTARSTKFGAPEKGRHSSEPSIGVTGAER